MTNEQKQAFTLRITQANSTEMIVILYEMVLEYLNEYKEALTQEDVTAQSEANRKTRGCFRELIASLNMRYEPAPTLLQLYLYCIRRLANASVHKEEKAIEDIRRVVEPLREAYSQLAAENHQGAVMSNSQTVYAGLTYGRNSLTENVADQGTNRGMLA